MDRRIAKLPPQDRSRFSSWILKFSDVFGGAGGDGGWWWVVVVVGGGGGG